MQKDLGLEATIIPQLSNIRWLSRAKCVKHIKDKWPALLEYFKAQVAKSNPREESVSEADDESEENQEQRALERRIKVNEKFILDKLNEREYFYYSKFLDDSLSHSSKFIRIFEEESFDVSKVFSTLKISALFMLIGLEASTQ